jgi:putative peptide zinc metalloprotease protein
MSQRPVPFAARRDVTAHQVRYGDQWYWVMKDPLRNELFRLRADQYAIHQLLDGRRSLEEIRARLASEFRDLTLSLAQLQGLVLDLFRKGLVWSTRSGQAAPLGRRQREGRRRRVLQALASPLFIRLPGWDPQRFLDRTYPRVRWLFHPSSLVAGALAAIATWLFVLVRFDEFRQRLPSLGEMTAAGSLVAMWAAIAAVKVLHELGHALACRRYGGECHEVGVALMILSPSMYCDVSDAGRLASRRARLAIGAAGMYVELVLSAVAFFLWWNTREGLLHQLSWTVFFVTNVSVVAFNLNPLLRLDGYYMLCDWLGVPNLRQKADRLFGRFWMRTALGAALPDDPLLPESRRWLFVSYAAASALFRLQLLLVISLVLYKALEPYGLQSLGLAMGFVALATSVGRGALAAVRGWRAHRHRWRGSRRPRFTLALLGAAAVAAFVVPFPVVVTAPLVVEPVGAQDAYVATAGRLTTVRVRPGQHVRKGEVLLELADRSTADNFRELQATYEAQCVAVTVAQATGDTAQEATAVQTRQALYEELAESRERLARLAVTAPCDGLVISPPAAGARDRSDDRLGRMTGTPLDQSNAGAWLPVGTHVATVAPGGAYQAVLLVDQFSRADFAPGRRVRIKLEHAPDRVLRGVIESQSAPVEPRSLAGDKFAAEKLAASREAGAAKAPRLSQMTVQLEAPEALLAPGLRGEARAVVFRSSLASWLWRQARLTFTFL